MSQPRLVLLVGAPSASAVDESSCTVRDFDTTFTRFLGRPADEKTLDATPSQAIAEWRSLPLRRDFHGLSQDHLELADDARHADFFTTADISRVDGSIDSSGGQDALTQFCEASLSALDGTSFLSDYGSFDTSFLTNSSADESRLSQKVPVPPAAAAHLSDLEDIPPASRIQALIPSTVTINIIVGILSIAQPRSVTTRWGKTISLIEVLVGDDTRSGFAVNFWVPEDQYDGSPVSKLRRQDVALMQNVALHAFRGQVYGQSLRRDMTKVSVLWSRDGRGVYSTRSLGKATPDKPQMTKAALVKDWALKFVGTGSHATKRKLRSWDQPPEDSQ